MLDKIGHQRRTGAPSPSRPRGEEEHTLAPSEERKTVPGGGALLVELRQGDRVSVTNTEGGQPCDLLAAHPDGRVDAGLLGLSADAPGDGLRSVLESGAPGVDRLRQGLARRGIDAGARTVGLFSGASPAGDRAEATAQAP
ncbi:urea carboxylase-associated family protein, partial [Salipiger sp. HF18]|nr:urea carboxylase-associated family protein [Salipiger sp. HF18]